MSTIAQNLVNIIGELIDSAVACQITPSMSPMAQNLGDIIKYRDMDGKLFYYAIKKACFDVIYLPFRNIVYLNERHSNIFLFIS